MRSAVSVRLAALTATVATGLVLVVPVASAAPATGSPCARYVAVLAPGTTETRADADPTKPAGMLGQVGQELQRRYGSQIQVVYPSYPAQAFLQSGMTYATSKTEGDRATVDALTRCPGSKFVIGGYSQGAQIANDVAVDIGTGSGPTPPASVLAVALLANPKRGTAGAKVVGPTLAGQGIGGPDARGFGALSGKVFDICHPDDKYCNTETSSNSFLASLGRILANPPGTVETAAGATVTPGTGAPTATATGQSTATSTQPTSTSATESTPNPTPSTSLTPGAATATGAGVGAGASSFLDAVTSDYGFADLSAAPGAASSLAASVDKLQTAGAPTSTSSALDIAAIGQQAKLLSGTFAPVAQTQSWMAANPSAREGLRTAAEGSPEAATSGVVDALDQIDIPKIVGAADQVVSLASSVLSGASALSGSAPSAAVAAPTDAASTYAALSGPAQTLSTSVSPLASTPADQLATATSVLSAIKPVTIINQVLGVVTGVTSVDYNGVAANLQALPGFLLSGNIKEAHRVSGELNNQLSPLVKMAAGVDLSSIARLISLIPDPSGTAAATSMVAGLLANVDVIRLARDVGQLQEVAWQVVETGNLLVLGQLLPIGIDLANVALGVLMPSQKMSADQLHAPTDAMTALMSTQAQSSDLVGLGNSALATVTSPDAAALGQVVDAGVTAASFLGSRVHESYGQWLVDGKRTALQEMVEIYTDAIGG
ncbi:cutinase family protein [Rhodococcus sp. 1R11]|uniref:cutinase family protein n=1 Tax=Rhodococcus sp. 1R11 TaxID=2559614 RepID=UPI00107281B7|nr:cutinase family protein [Rhodococcus sp. 1R11]TFI44810.1 cutinase family protein [Rhodococcus sp. 1R11]